MAKHISHSGVIGLGNPARMFYTAKQRDKGSFRAPARFQCVKVATTATVRSCPSCVGRVRTQAHKVVLKEAKGKEVLGLLAP